MTSFSPSDAALSGAQVIRRHWRVVAGWALFNLVALVAMIVVTVVVAIGVSAGAGGGASELSGVLGGLVATVGTAAIQVILVGGLYRLMLRPEEPAFLHLRIGPDELRIFGVWLVLMLAIFLIVGLAVVGAAAARDIPMAGVVIVVAGFAAAVWLGVRFSMAAPASFARRRFVLLESWRITRGHVWALIGMSLLAACLVALLSVLAWVALVLVSGLTAGFGSVIEAMSDPQALQTHPGLYLSQMAFELILSPFMIVLGAAPAMAAYRALDGDGA